MINPKKLDGPQKAAILLMAMGDDFAREIFKNLTHPEMQLLAKRMAGLEDITVPVSTVQGILKEFQNKCAEVSGITGKGVAFLEKAIVDALGNDKAKPILESIHMATDKSPFSTLRQVDTSILVDYLRGEHPQTVALVLAHLDSQKCAQIIKNLPEKLQAEIIFRMSNLGVIPSGVIEELDQVLRKEIEAMGTMESRRLGGVEAVAEIINQLDSNTENNIFSSLEETDADLAEKIRQKMFVFEDIINIDNRGVQSILKEITNEDLLLALKTASEPLKEKIFANMSSRASEMIKEDMETMGPVKLSDVEQAQQSIIRVVRKLETAGKIVIGGKGGEDVLV